MNEKKMILNEKEDNIADLIGDFKLRSDKEKDGFLDRKAKDALMSSLYMVNKYGSDAVLDQNVRRKDLHSNYVNKAASWDIQNLLYNDTRKRGIRTYDIDKDGKIIEKGLDASKPNFLIRLKRMLTDKPRNFIAHVAAALRSTYRKWLLKANKEKDANKLKWYKNILRLILKGIDFVLNKLEGLHVNYTKRMVKDFRKKNPKLSHISDSDIVKYFIRPELHSDNLGFIKRKLIKRVGRVDDLKKTENMINDKYMNTALAFDTMDGFKDINRIAMSKKDEIVKQLKDIPKEEKIDWLTDNIYGGNIYDFGIGRNDVSLKKYPHILKNMSKKQRNLRGIKYPNDFLKNTMTEKEYNDTIEQIIKNGGNYDDFQ